MRYVALLAVVLLQLATRAAASDAPVRLSNVTLVQSACPLYETAEFVRLLQIELALRGVRSLEIRNRSGEVTMGNAGLAVVQIHCDPEQTSVSVEVADLTSGNRMRRDLSLADLVRTMRARALSLAVSALIDAAWFELALREDEDTLPRELANTLRKRIRIRLEEPATAPSPIARPEPQPALALMTAARTYPSRGAGLFGLELHYTPLLSNMRLSVNAEALFGQYRASDNQGEIARMSLYALGAGLGLFWASTTQPELAVGPLVRLGYAAASAADLRAGAAAKSGGAFVASAGFSALLRAHLARAWDLWLGVDLGYSLSGVAFRVAKSEVTGMSDLTFGLRAGVGTRL